MIQTNWKTGDRYALWIGDCRDGLRHIHSKSVHCCVCSPPYWGLRDYGIPPVMWADGEHCVFGLEASIDSYVRHSIEVIDSIMRVLRDDGVLWWNLGDSYATTGGADKPGKTSQRGGRSFAQVNLKTRKETSIANGNKYFIPHRVAIAVQEAGYTVRQDVVWHKRSPMPESVNGWRFKDGKLRRGSWRHTTAHEYVFMITKSKKYFCDGDAAREPVSGNAHSRGKGLNPKATKGSVGREKQNASFSQSVNGLVGTRNPRSVDKSSPDREYLVESDSVLTLSTEPCKEAHFATFPRKLIRPLIQASTSAGGCCDQCGQCFAPVVESERVPTRPGANTKVSVPSGWDTDPGRSHGSIHREGRTQKPKYRDAAEVGNRDPKRHVTINKTTGYRQTCDCQESKPSPCLVLDPFTGSGTTGLVALELGHNFIGCEASEAYANEIAIPRIQKVV